MSETENAERAVSSPKKSGWKVVGTIIKVLFVIVLGIAFGVAAFLGLPELYRGFMVPVQQNEARIESLEEESENQHLQAETFRNETSETVAGFEGKLAGLTEQNAELAASISLYEDLLQELRDDLFSVQQENAQLQKELERVVVLEEQVSSFETALSEERIPVQEMRLQIQIVRVLEMINRAQNSIGQENYGSAEEDLQLTVEVLDGLLVSIDETDQELVENARAHLELAKAKLPAQPRLALNELELSWAELLNFLEPSEAVANQPEAVLEQSESE
ncbi:MAG: hypothetical protein JXA25_05215 [Anaerolineales bacterium]|nr:hypothetical protein [Anaerolineales bacterium]